MKISRGETPEQVALAICNSCIRNTFVVSDLIFLGTNLQEGPRGGRSYIKCFAVEISDNAVLGESYIGQYKDWYGIPRVLFAVLSTHRRNLQGLRLRPLWLLGSHHLEYLEQYWLQRHPRVFSPPLQSYLPQVGSLSPANSTPSQSDVIWGPDQRGAIAAMTLAALHDSRQSGATQLYSTETWPPLSSSGKVVVVLLWFLKDGKKGNFHMEKSSQWENRCTRRCTHGFGVIY